MADKTDVIDIPSIVTAPAASTAPAIVADKSGKTKPKRLSQSARTYRRRLKQASHKPGEAGK